MVFVSLLRYICYIPISYKHWNISWCACLCDQVTFLRDLSLFVFRIGKSLEDVGSYLRNSVQTVNIIVMYIQTKSFLRNQKYVLKHQNATISQ